MCIAARAWDVAMEPSSKMAWFNLAGIVIITGACVDNFLIYRRRIKRGILFGRECVFPPLRRNEISFSCLRQASESTLGRRRGRFFVGFFVFFLFLKFYSYFCAEFD